MPISAHQITAMRLVSLGPQWAAQALKGMDPDEIEAVVGAMLRLDDLPAARFQAIADLAVDAGGAEAVRPGGIAAFGREVLARTVGTEMARAMLARLSAGSPRAQPFGFVAELEPAQVAEALAEAPADDVGFALAHLPVGFVDRVLVEWELERQAAVTAQLCLMAHPRGTRIAEVEGAIWRRLGALAAPTFRSVEANAAGGVHAAVALFRAMEPARMRGVIERIGAQDPELADEIRRKMFVFEDLRQLDDAALQRLLQTCTKEDVVTALRNVSDETRRQILLNVSRAARQQIEEELAAAGPVRLQEVEAAQRRVVDALRALQEAEEVMVPHDRI